MKGIMKAVRPSYLHLSNILSGRIGFSNRIIESSFSTRPECSGSTSQSDSTLFQKNSNPTRRDQSRRKINQNNKLFKLLFNYVIKHSIKFVDVNCIQKINSFKNKNLKRQHCWAAVDYNFKSNIHFYNVLENINEKVTLKIYLKHYFNCASLSDLSSIKHMWQV